MAVETPVVVDLLYDFQCDECDFATDSQDYLKTHKRIKHENEGIIYRCDICNQTFNYPWAIKPHKDELHNENLLFYCKYCNHISNSTRNMNRHEKKCLLSRQKDQCQKCGKFLKLSHLLRHNKEGCGVSKKKDPSTLVFNCDNCDYKTDKDIYLRKHIVRNHSKNVVQCDFCKFRTPFEVTLRIHIIRFHPLLQCESCDFQTNIKDKMSEHHRNIHPFTCKHCEFSTIFEYSMKLHVCEAHGQEIDCDFKEKEKCNYVVTSMEDWKNHRISQHNLDIYSCKKCSFITGNKHELSPHNNYYHKICKIIFPTKFYLKNHEKTEHKDLLLFCEYCHLFFTQNDWRLKAHKYNKHFVCMKCDTISRDKKQLISHMKDVHAYVSSISKNYLTMNKKKREIVPKQKLTINKKKREIVPKKKLTMNKKKREIVP